MDERADLGPRLDRELSELLQELRVAQNGVQILVGFLLVIPFTHRFADVTTFQRTVYYLTLLCAGAAAVVILAPVSYHRFVFRLRHKESLVLNGNALAIAGMGLLAVAILGVLVLVTDFLFSTSLALVMAAMYVLFVGTLWYALPLRARHNAAVGSR